MFSRVFVYLLGSRREILLDENHWSTVGVPCVRTERAWSDSSQESSRQAPA